MFVLRFYGPVNPLGFFRSQLIWIYTDCKLDLHWLQRQGISGFSRICVKDVKKGHTKWVCCYEAPVWLVGKLETDTNFFCLCRTMIVCTYMYPTDLALLFAIKYVNLYQERGSSNLIGWKLEVGVASCYPAGQGLAPILSLPLIQEGQLSVSGERMCIILVNRWGLSLPSKRVVR